MRNPKLAQASHAEIIYYIHQTPVVSGFVEEAEHWIYSSAKCYSDNKGLIKIN